MNATNVRRRAAVTAASMLLSCATAAWAGAPPASVRLADSGGAVRSLQIADDTRVLTAVMEDGTIRSWGLADGAASASVPLPADWKLAVTLVSGGRAALGAKPDGSIETLSVAPGSTPTAGLGAIEGGPFTDVSFVTAARGDLVIARYRGPATDEDPRGGRSARVLAVSVNGNPRLLRKLDPYGFDVRFGATGSKRLVQVFMSEVTTELVTDGSLRRRVARVRSPGDLWGPTISSDDGWVALLDRTASGFVHAGDGSGQRRVLESELDSGPDTGVPPFPFAASPTAFVPRRAVLVVGQTTHSRVRLWNTATGAVLHDLPVEPGSEIRVDVSPLGKFLATTSGQGITVWNLDPQSLPRLADAGAAAESEPPEGATARLGASPWRYGGEVHGVALSPDAAVVYTSDDSGTLEARRTADMQPVWKQALPGGAAKELLLTPDGKTLLVARTSARVALMEAASGRLLDEIPHDDALGGTFQNAFTIALDRTGERVALGGASGTVVWNLASSGGEAFFPGWKADLGLGIKTPCWPVGLVFGPGESTLSSYCIDGRMRTYDLERAGTTEGTAAKGVWVQTVTSADRGKTVVLGTDTGAVTALQGGREVLLGRGFGRELDRGQVFLPGTPRDRVLVRPGTGEVWRTGEGGIARSEFSGGELQKLPVAHAGAICALAFSADGSTAFSGSVDRTVCRWDAEKGEHGPRPSGHLARVTAIAYTPDSRAIASAGRGEGVMIWPAVGGAPKRTIRTGSNHVVALGFSAKRTALAAVTAEPDQYGDPAPGPTLRILSATNGKESLSRKLDTKRARCVALDSAGKRALVGTDAGLLFVTKQGTRAVNVARADEAATVVAVGFTPDGKAALAATPDSIVLLDAGRWNVLRRYELPETDGRGRWQDARIDRAGRTVVAVDHHGRACSWEFATGKLLRAGTFATRRAQDVALSADGSLAATLSKRGVLVVRRVRDDAHVLSLPALRVDGDRDVFALAPDGSSLATVEPDGTLLVWNLAK